LFNFIGLDPAGPYFENTDPSVRLDPTDALFVDVIHTDGTNNLLLGLGIKNNAYIVRSTFYTILSFQVVFNEWAM
jgi:hypothetical protein